MFEILPGAKALLFIHGLMSGLKPGPISGAKNNGEIQYLRFLGLHLVPEGILSYAQALPE